MLNADQFYGTFQNSDLVLIVFERSVDDIFFLEFKRVGAGLLYFLVAI